MSKLRTDELENLSGSVTILVANLLQSSDLTATNTTYDNTSSGLTATDVQDAIDEVDSNLDSTDSSLSSHTGDDTIHRTINDAGTATTDLWSADKIGTELSGKLDTTAQAADSDLLDGQEGTYYLDRANHTGTNDADTLDGQDSPYYLDRTNHTGTQTLSTISDSGTAASADLTTSATDTTSDRVLKVGDFGSGANSVASTNWDNVDFGSFLRTGDSTQPEMPIAQNFVGFHSQFNSIHKLQLALELSTDISIWARRRNNSGWSDWRYLFNNNNILGTVSQSSGVPTGAIIEQGSNSNGEYTKFADGTMMCWAQGLSVTTVSSGYLLTGSWSFPAAFATAPETVMFNEGVGATNQSTVEKTAACGPASITNTSTSIRIGSIAGSSWVSGDEFNGVQAIAKGRWF